MSVMLAAMYHTQKGQRLLEQRLWQEAAAEFSRAIWAAGGNPGREALTGRACAVLQCDEELDCKLAALADARSCGFSDPRFWALCVRFYLITFDHNRARLKSVSRKTRRCMLDLEAKALFDIRCGILTYQRHVQANNPDAFVWGAALVAMGDWAHEFANPQRVETDPLKFPFRPLAESLYRPVAEDELAKLFDDPDLQREIERNVTGRARRQISRITIPRRMTSRRKPKWRYWSIFAFKAFAAVAMVFQGV